MNQKNCMEYNIGLDIGTNSVGWAVTDLENNILKYKNRNMWGARLFDSGTTAAQTRIFRGTRRRIERRRERIKILQSLLIDDMEKDYPNFFHILNESSKIEKENKYNLFSELDFSDKDYYKKLPKLNYNEMIDILMSFLKDFDNDIYLKLSKKGKEGKIIETQINYYGYVLPFESIKDSIIVINNDSDIYNLSFMSTLAHECGHLFEIEHLYSQDNITFRRDSMSSIFCEVSSTFFEYAFLRYLEDNKIFENRVKDEIVLHKATRHY